MTSRQHMDCTIGQCLVDLPTECPWFATTKPDPSYAFAAGHHVRLHIRHHGLHTKTGVLVAQKMSDPAVWLVAVDDYETTDRPDQPERYVHRSYLRLMPPIIDELPG